MRYSLFTILICGLLLISTKASAKEISASLWPGLSLINSRQHSNDVELKTEMKKYLGVRYRRGGSTKRGMDCSGLVRRVYSNSFKVDLPHKASLQYHSPALKKTPLNNLITGDLIFFSFSKNKKRVTHVGIYLSDGLFIHAAQKNGVIISRVDNHYWKSRIVAAKRLISRQLWAAMESFESVGGIKIFTPDEKNTLQIQYAGLEFHPFPSHADHLLFPDNQVNRFHSFEIGYTRKLWKDLWSFNLTAFRDTFTPGHDGKNFMHPLGSEESYLSNTESYSTYRQGISLSSDINPFKWLRITPSLSYLDYGQRPYQINPPERYFGLEVSLRSLESKWSFSTAFQYHDIHPLTAKIFDSDKDMKALDISLAFRHRLSDNMLFSLIGQRVIKSNSDSYDNFNKESQTDHSLFFTLDFTY